MSCSSNGEDPWDECIQSGCEILNSKVGEIPPYHNPREYYRTLRTYWAFDLPVPDSLLAHPFGKQFPPAVALLYLLGKRKTPTIFSRGSQFLTLPELCQLTLLWAIAGKEEEARDLGRFILEKKLSLWCPESHYEEGKLSYSLLLRAFCLHGGTLKKPIDPFLLALAKKSPRLGTFEKKKREMEAALTLTGEGSGMGSITFKDIEIRAMGPQLLPLGQLNQFGIHLSSDEPNPQWTRCYALPEVWIEVKSQIEDNACQLGLRFIGLEAEKPLAFVFYIHAQQCLIGTQSFKPKSLHRYAGEAQSFLFQGKEGTLKIESTSHKVQLIPLAGEGGFWDTEFILAFEIAPMNPSAHFKISRT